MNAQPTTVGPREWKLISDAERGDVDLLVKIRVAYEQAYGELVTEKHDYVRIKNQIEKLLKQKQVELIKLESERNSLEAKEGDYSNITDSEKWQLSRKLLNPRFRKFVGLAGTTELIKIRDEENMLVSKVINPKAIREQLADTIAEHCTQQGTIYSPHFIDELVRFWERYGDSIEEFAVYGGFKPDSWCLGRSLHSPNVGEMPTWKNFMSRMNDPEAFAAWIYGVASKRYRGRQILWLKGENGEDGKSYIQRLIAKNLFPNVSHAMANSAFSEGAARFIGAEFENKALAYWDDCNNTMALFREDVKMLSSGAEGNASRIEHKGVMAYQAQLEARMWINSNYAPSVSHDNFVRSRLLYITLGPMREEQDIEIGKKFEVELSAFLKYGEEMFDKLCKDSRKVRQCESALAEIDDLADNFEEHHETIFTNAFEVGESDRYVTCRHIQDVLKREGLKDVHKQSDWYRWLERRKSLVRKKHQEDGKSIKVVFGMTAKSVVSSSTDWSSRSYNR